MAAYPFRKMTTNQLTKLLRDEPERDLQLSETPDRPDIDQPAYPAIRIRTIPSRQSEISTESR
jgi:hypothetical protein